MSDIKKLAEQAKKYGSLTVTLDVDGVLALQQKPDAVLAENVALKDISAWCKTEAFENMYREFKTAEAIGCPEVDCMHDAMLTALMHAPLTPATDAILNEVRAEGVTALHKEQLEQALVTWQYDNFDALKRAALRYGDSELSGVIFMLERIEEFAAQLRAGSKEGDV